MAGRSFEARPARTGDGRILWWLSDDTARRRAVEALERAEAELERSETALERARADLGDQRERTAFLARTSEALATVLNAERCTELIARLAADHLADGAVVIAATGGRDHRVAHAAGRDAGHGRADGDPRQVPGLSEALSGFPPGPSRRVDSAALPCWAVPPGFAGPAGEALITPLPGHGLCSGALILLRSADRAPLTEDDEVLVRLFAARAGAALAAARAYAEQAAVSATLMREMLPPRLRPVRGVDFAGGYRAGRRTERVGGDFYDVHPGNAAGGETLAVLGDVCGKGLEAAVLTGKIRTTLQALLPMAGDHARVLRLLNGVLLDGPDTSFATLVLASVVRRGRRAHLRLTSAGHPPPLVVRADGTVQETRTRGTLVGVLDEIETESAEVELAPGETCLLFSDGITEARGGPLGGAMFGVERLAAALRACAGMPAEAVVEHVQMLAAQWVGEHPHDDMAVVAVTSPPLASGACAPQRPQDGGVP
ncbi:PP2C family protein-serine/threonine phosphatase [Streptomyces sulfonofaciens]|uniref:PP2C family protein-serine/threonine phosphatase n=1 Tax=Streptomyces sulfonofaciens TaxID=68272 RepID=UPI003570CCC3